MNNDLKNYSTQPDPEVWDRIQKTLHRRALRRRIATFAGAVAAVAAIFVAGVAILRPSAADTPAIAEIKLETADRQSLTRDANPMTPEEIAAARQERLSPATPATKTVAQTSKSQPAEQTATAKPENYSEPHTAQPSQPSAPQSVTAPAPTTPSIAAAAPAPIAPAIATEASTTDIIAAAEEPQQVPTTAKSPTSNPNEDTILWIPNVFAPGSPNADISTFRVKMNQPGESISDYRIIIFSRSGQQVYISHNIDQSWDGTFKGRELPQGAYVYVIQYTDSRKLKHIRKGTITLLK